VNMTGTGAKSLRERAADPLARAIEGAQQNLLRLQHAEAIGAASFFVDSTLCSDYVLYMHWADEVDPVLVDKCAAHIRRRQLRTAAGIFTKAAERNQRRRSKLTSR